MRRNRNRERQGKDRGKGKKPDASSVHRLAPFEFSVDRVLVLIEFSVEQCNSACVNLQ
jgi:hypothetical protein